MTKTINILGVTGSIGRAVQDVVDANPGLFDVNVVSAHSDEVGLRDAAERLGAKQAVLTSKDEIVLDEEVDITVCGIVGMAGLPSMMQAIEVSKAVAIANKEPLVAAGDLVMAAARKAGTQLLPIDSEHNAVFQVFEESNRDNIGKIILTASGGPFREWSAEEIAAATPEQALKHPNWEMGKKITIDSATMANKALEVIEAHYLFDLSPEQIEVVIHPQSVIHSMVEYKDGSVLAQMGASDMRVPIAYVLGYPERIESAGQKIDFKSLKQLSFDDPDPIKFPFLPLAYECLAQGQSACVVFNAANEMAVNAFLTHRIGFGDIIGVVKECLDKVEFTTLDDLQSIQSFDTTVREMAETYITQSNNHKKSMAR